LELSGAVKKMVEARELEMGHARALLGIADASAQVAAARKVAARGLSVRETEALVKRLNEPARKPAPASKADPDVVRLQNDLGEKLGAEVVLRQTRKGGGQLIIRYNTLEELDGILSRIR
jgi:ParB family chromosome partitioning protein